MIRIPLLGRCSRLAIPALGALGVFLLAGCRKNEQASSASELEKAFQVRAPAPDAAPAAPAPAPPGDENARVQQAVTGALGAMRTNGYADAYITLRAVQASPTLTADQVIAVQNARQALEKSVAARAASGDPAALRAVEEMKRGARR